MIEMSFVVRALLPLFHVCFLYILLPLSTFTGAYTFFAITNTNCVSCFYLRLCYMACHKNGFLLALCAILHTMFARHCSSSALYGVPAILHAGNASVLQWLYNVRSSSHSISLFVECQARHTEYLMGLKSLRIFECFIFSSFLIFFLFCSSISINFAIKLSIFRGVASVWG